MAQPKPEVSALLRELIAHQDRRAYDAAADSCARALRLAPRDADALHLMGVTECLRGRNDAALPLFNRVIALAPGHARAHGSKGTLLLALRRPAEAVRPLRRAIQLAPNNAEAHMHL